MWQRRAHHLVGIHGGSGLNDSDMAITRDAHAGLRRHDRTDAAVGLKDRGRLVDDLLGGGITRNLADVVGDHNLQSRGVQTVELPGDEFTSPHRLAAAVLPPGAGQFLLHLHAKRAEHGDHHQPGDENVTKMCGRPNAQA